MSVEHASPAAGGRRRAAAESRRRPSLITVLGLLIPLLTVGALALVAPPDPVDTTRSPSEAPQARSTLVCPGVGGGRGDILAASASAVEGELVTRSRGEEESVSLERGTTTIRETGPLALQGEGEMAPGLLATRTAGGRTATCDEPAPEQWFTGVGASAEHSSVLTLTNPDKGPAVADVTVLGADGLLDVPALRGVRVLGSRVARFDLSRVVPSTDALALHVVVTRGRLGAHVTDVVDQLGRGGRAEGWLPGQAAPAETSYVVGTGGGSRRRVLSMANPGDSETRVQVRLVNEDSEFVPAGLEEVAVPPQSVVEVDLGRVLRGGAGRGSVAVRLDSSGPVTASLRTLAGQDLSVAVAGPPVTRSAVVLPEGDKRLVLAGATAPGVVDWEAYDAQGRPAGEDRLEVDPGTGERIALPEDATLLLLGVKRTDVVASVEVGPPGLAVLPLAELVTVSLVPDVRPALPLGAEPSESGQSP